MAEETSVRIVYIGVSMTKLIACDLDGTLLQSNKQISERTLHILHEIVNRGHEFVIATGRSFNDVQVVLQQFPASIQPSLVLNSGAEYRGRNTHIVHPIPRDALYHLLKITQKYHLVESIQSVKGKYIIGDKDQYYRESYQLIKEKNGFTDHEMKQVDFIQPENYLRHLQAVESLDGFMAQHVDVMKVDARALEEQAAQQAAKEISAHPDLMISSSYYSFLEVTSSQHTKATMLLELIKKRQIDPEDVIVFGDSDNDYDMLRTFNQSYAMGNSDERIKAAARYEALSNDADGVAVVLEQLFPAD